MKPVARWRLAWVGAALIMAACAPPTPAPTPQPTATPAPTPTPTAPAPKPITLTILHSNDVEGFIYPCG